MIRKMLRRFLRRTDGQGLAEYALILALVSTGVVTVLGLLTGSLNTTMNQVINAL